MSFSAPVDDIAFTLEYATDFPALRKLSEFADFGSDTLMAVLGEAARFSDDVVAPLNRVGDIEGARLENGVVKTPAGFADAYHAFVDGGWMGLSASPDHGGQGLPYSVNVAVCEMINSGSMAFALSALLTQSAASTLAAHGSDDLKRRFLDKLTSGEWSGTMNLTEPQSGSDLATIKSRAEPAGDGSYLIHGQKIYITYGEQEWTENIIHLVLARLPHAPEGTRGISLFLVPKRLVDENGNVGDANEVRALRLEEKLGIHASPTCVMSYGETLGAVGYLVGEPHQGLGAMFTMMNLARLMVGTQGVAVAERATQQAQEFANVRLQGRRDGDPSNVSVPIIRHPDVKRMLVKMSALTAAARSICLNAAVAFDLSRHGEEENTRAAANARADLLTPIAKSFATDIGVDVASTGVQVHGGSGYMEETGAAQHLRDARILPIYEGTNGIQAIDLVLRKVARDNGKEAQLLIEEIRGYAHDAITSNDPRFCQLGYSLNEAVEHLADATDWVVSTALSDRDRVLAGACAYLRLFALTAGCGFLARGALGSVRDRPDHEESARAVFLTQFFSETILGESVGLHRSVTRTGEIIKAGGSQIKA